MPKTSVMHGPFEVEMKVRLRAGDNTATVTYSLPAGVYPTLSQMQEAVAKALKGAADQLGDDGVRLLSRPEFQNEVLAEHTGRYIEFAAPEHWDKV